MGHFDFVRDEKLRDSLEADYRELRLCLDAGAFKAVHVLSGSLVEALLIDALAAKPVTRPTPLEELTLAPLVTLAKNEHILSADSENLTTVVRQYRNLIHPGRLKRLEKSVDNHGAVVAAALVEMIRNEIAKHKEATYGYTAKQLLDRLRSGPSAIPLVSHLFAASHADEIRMLLTKLIPEAYDAAEYESQLDIDHLLKCYTAAYNTAPDHVKREVTAHVYEVYRTGAEPTVLTYERHFFRASQLGYLGLDEQQFIKAHLLPRIDDEKTLVELLNTLDGIGPYLRRDEARNLGERYIDYILTAEDIPSKGRVRFALNRDFSAMSRDNREAVLDNIRGYVDAVEGEQTDFAAITIKLKRQLELKHAKLP